MLKVLSRSQPFFYVRHFLRNCCRLKCEEELKIEKHKPNINQMMRVTCPLQACKCTRRGDEGKFLGLVYHPRGSPPKYLAYQCPKKKSKIIEIEIK